MFKVIRSYIEIAITPPRVVRAQIWNKYTEDTMKSNRSRISPKSGHSATNYKSGAQDVSTNIFYYTCRLTTFILSISTRFYNYI